MKAIASGLVDRTRELYNELTKLANALGDEMAVIISTLCTCVVNTVYATGYVGSQIISAVTNLVKEIGNVTSTLITALYAGLTKLVNAIGNASSKVIRELCTGVVNIVTAIAIAAPKVINASDKLIAIGQSQIVKKIVQGLLLQLPTSVAPQVKQLLM